MSDQRTHCNTKPQFSIELKDVYKRQNQGDVSTMMKLSPFMITLWAAIFLKEKIRKVQVPALLIAFLGAAFVANPAFNSNLFPLFMAFLCAFFSSVSYTLLAYSKNKVDGMTIIMHFSTFCVLACIPFMIFAVSYTHLRRPWVRPNEVEVKFLRSRPATCGLMIRCV